MQIASETQSWRTVVRTNSGRFDSHRKRKHPVFFLLGRRRRRRRRRRKRRRRRRQLLFFGDLGCFLLLSLLSSGSVRQNGVQTDNGGVRLPQPVRQQLSDLQRPEHEERSLEAGRSDSRGPRWVSAPRPYNTSVTVSRLNGLCGAF